MYPRIKIIYTNLSIMPFTILRFVVARIRLPEYLKLSDYPNTRHITVQTFLTKCTQIYFRHSIFRICNWWPPYTTQVNNKWVNEMSRGIGAAQYASRMSSQAQSWVTRGQMYPRLRAGAYTKRSGAERRSISVTIVSCCGPLWFCHDTLSSRAKHVTHREPSSVTRDRTGWWHDRPRIHVYT